VRDGVADHDGWPLYLRRYAEQLAKNVCESGDQPRVAAPAQR